MPTLLDWSRQAHAAELRIENARLRQELESTRERLRTTSAEATRVFLEVERANALRSKRAWSAMFALIVSCLPSDCWLASLATDPDSPPGGAPSPRLATAGPKTGGGERETITIEAPRKLRMIGYAESDRQALAFVSNLKESRVFPKVTLDRTIRAPDVTQDQSGATGADVYQFEVVCEW